MRPEDPDILDVLEQAGGLTDLARVHTFRGYHVRPNDEVVEVTVEILDRGSESNNRWTVSAFDDEDHFADSEPSADLQDAIRAVAWSALDEPDV